MPASAKSRLPRRFSPRWLVGAAALAAVFAARPLLAAHVDGQWGLDVHGLDESWVLELEQTQRNVTGAVALGADSVVSRGRVVGRITRPGDVELVVQWTSGSRNGIDRLSGRVHRGAWSGRVDGVGGTRLFSGRRIR